MTKTKNFRHISLECLFTFISTKKFFYVLLENLEIFRTKLDLYQFISKF